MIRAEIVDAVRNLFGVGAIGIHDPNRRSFACSRAAEDDLLAVGGLAGSKIPDGRVAVCQCDNFSGDGIELADLGTTVGLLGLIVAIEVVRVRPIGLIFPRNLRVW